MGRPCKELRLSPSHLRSLEELSTQAKSLGCCDVSVIAAMQLGASGSYLCRIAAMTRKYLSPSSQAGVIPPDYWATGGNPLTQALSVPPASDRLHTWRR